MTENWNSELQNTDETAETSVKDKRIYLIRHAESQNNVAKRDSYTVWRRLRQGDISWPSNSEWSSIGSLLTIPMDTDLSPNGLIQVNTLQKHLQAIDFVNTHSIELIVHSHLIRARRTCHTLFADHPLTTIVSTHSISQDNMTKNSIDHVESDKGMFIFAETCLAFTT